MNRTNLILCLLILCNIYWHCEAYTCTSTPAPTSLTSTHAFEETDYTNQVIYNVYLVPSGNQYFVIKLTDSGGDYFGLLKYTLGNLKLWNWVQTIPDVPYRGLVVKSDESAAYFLTKSSPTFLIDMDPSGLLSIIRSSTIQTAVCTSDICNMKLSPSEDYLFLALMRGSSPVICRRDLTLTSIDCYDVSISSARPPKFVLPLSDSEAFVMNVDASSNKFYFSRTDFSGAASLHTWSLYSSGYTINDGSQSVAAISSNNNTIYSFVSLYGGEPVLIGLNATTGSILNTVVYSLSLSNSDWRDVLLLGNRLYMLTAQTSTSYITIFNLDGSTSLTYRFVNDLTLFYLGYETSSERLYLSGDLSSTIYANTMRIAKSYEDSSGSDYGTSLESYSEFSGFDVNITTNATTDYGLTADPSSPTYSSNTFTLSGGGPYTAGGISTNVQENTGLRNTSDIFYEADEYYK